MSAFIPQPDGDYLVALCVIGGYSCPRCKSGQVHPRMNKSGSAHVADQCGSCGDAIWHDWPFYPGPSMLPDMANAEPSQLVVGRLNRNGAEIFQSDLEHVALLGFANELVRRATLAKGPNTDTGNVRAQALLDAANSIRYVLNMPAEVIP